MSSVPLCSKCHVPLLQDQKGSLVADVCPQCGGVLLSREAWHLAQQDWASALAMDEAYSDSNPMPVLVLEMPCPYCGVGMTTFYPLVAPNLSLELCPQCGAVWLDDGELSKLAEAVRARHPSTPAPLEPGQEEPVEVEVAVERIYCAHCGRENFSDALRCWACGELLVPEEPPLPQPLQTVAELMSIGVSGLGAVLFGWFLHKPQGGKWAALGLSLMVLGLALLAALRRLWRRGKSTPIFPTYSDQ